MYYRNSKIAFLAFFVALFLFLGFWFFWIVYTKDTKGFAPVVSGEGRYIVYDDGQQVYVKDIQVGEVDIASTNDVGQKGNGNSFRATISTDGRFVVFISDSTNLTNDALVEPYNVYLKDMKSNSIKLVNSDPTIEIYIEDCPTLSPFRNYAINTPVVSDDGRFVFFGAVEKIQDLEGFCESNILVKDMKTGAISLIAKSATDPSISTDGRYVTYAGYSFGNDNNPIQDIYSKDLKTQNITKISPDAGVAPNNAADFIFGPSSNVFSNPSMSGDGRIITFEEETYNGINEIYVKNLSSGSFVFIAPGKESTISKNGRDIVYSNYRGVFLYDIQTASSKNLINPSSEGKTYFSKLNFQPAISSDGRYLIFHSDCANCFIPDLIPGVIHRSYNDSDGIILKDLWTGEISLQS